jgi:hypothetical protein
MHVTDRRTEIILGILADRFDLTWCSHYGEPGYTDPTKGILFANWNDIEKHGRRRFNGQRVPYNERARRSTICNYLEAAGFELEWSDEWYVDYNHDKAWRTSPDSYSWQCQVAYTDGDILTPDDDISDWIEAFQDDADRALPSRFTADDLTEMGFVRFGDRFENGWHQGQTDDPHEIAKAAEAVGAEHFIFRLTEVSQFDVRFECWVQMPEEDDEH